MRAEAAGAIEQLDGADPVLGDALLDLAGLLVGVDVQRQPLGTRVAPDLLQPLGRARPHGVGGDADPDPAPTELLDLLEVLGRGFLAEAGDTSARVRGEEQRQRDAGLVRGLRGGECLGEPEVVELPDRRVAGGVHLGIGLDVLGAHGLRRLAFRLGEHHFAPGPEIAALGAPAQTRWNPCEWALTNPGSARRHVSAALTGDYPRVTMAADTAPLPILAKLPNALTIARFALIPVFIVLLAQAEGGHSWAAGIIFGVAAITDQVDGWLARRWHVESEFGKYADPLADRLMIDTAVIMLFIADRLPWAALVVIIARDVLLVVGTKFVLGQSGYEFSVSFLGKAATWVLYAGIAFVLVTPEGTSWPLWIFWIGLGMAVGAGALYAASAWRTIRGGRRVEVTET